MFGDATMSEPKLTDSTESLPPVPDDTGEPHPPSAPRIVGPAPGRRQPRPSKPKDHFSFDTGDAEWDTFRSAAALEEVSCLTPISFRVVAATLSAAREPGVVLPGGLWVISAVYTLVTGQFDEHASDYWGFPSVIGIWFLLTFGYHWFNASRVTLTGGPHIISDTHDDKVWLYELDTITAVDNRRGGPSLELTGTFGRTPQTASLPLDLLEGNQRMWDLVYNGIRHSTAHGAQVDDHTRQLLHLPPAAPGHHHPRHRHRRLRFTKW